MDRKISKKMPTLHLQVCAGFANRIRALVSGICLAEDLQCPLVVHWFPRSPECVCRFATVLDPESLPKTVKVVPDDLYMAADILSQDTCQLFIRRWDRKSDLSIKSHGIFYTNDRWESHLRNIRPSRMVKDFLDRRCANVDWGTAVGVQIRRTDNKKSIAESPLELFLEAMRKDKEAFYVVATDDSDIRKELELEFGDRCVFPSLVLSRRSEEGMIHAVADFLALSKCSRILGSSGSSYGEMAARYGNIPLEILKN